MVNRGEHPILQSQENAQPTLSIHSCSRIAKHRQFWYAVTGLNDVSSNLTACQMYIHAQIKNLNWYSFSAFPYTAWMSIQVALARRCMRGMSSTYLLHHSWEAVQGYYSVSEHCPLWTSSLYALAAFGEAQSVANRPSCPTNCWIHALHGSSPLHMPGAQIFRMMAAIIMSPECKLAHPRIMLITSCDCPWSY